jgi:hypothetical protein
MGLNVKLYNIISDGSYSIRYKSGDYPYPETIDSTFTFYGSGLTDASITISGLTFDTQYWIKMTDETTGRYIIKNIYSHDSKAFSCYDTICFDVETLCLSPTPTSSVTPTPTSSLIVSSTPTPTPTLTPTPSLGCSDSIRNTLAATNVYTAVGRQGMIYSSSNNKAYVLNSTNTVQSFVPNSTTLTNEFTWSGASYLLGYNSTNNKLYSWEGSVPVRMFIRDLNTNTTSSISISGLTTGFGKIEYNSVLNKIYAFSNNAGNFSISQISVIDGSTDTFTNQITGITLASGHATVYNPNNNKLYFAQGGRIYTCSGNTITLEGTTLPITSANLIALDETNNIIYLVSASTVYKIDVATNNTLILNSISGAAWNTTILRSMIYNPDNGKLYISRYSSPSDGFLGVLDPTTGVFTEIIGDGISQPLYVPTNTIYGINDNALYEICGSISSPTSSPTPTPTPTPTKTLTPTPTPSISYKTWTIQECTSPCISPQCGCAGQTSTTVYTAPNFTDITDPSTVICINTTLTLAFTGFFSLGGEIYDVSTGSPIQYCTVGADPC